MFCSVTLKFNNPLIIEFLLRGKKILKSIGLSVLKLMHLWDLASCVMFWKNTTPTFLLLFLIDFFNLLSIFSASVWATLSYFALIVFYIAQFSLWKSGRLFWHLPIRFAKKFTKSKPLIVKVLDNFYFYFTL